MATTPVKPPNGRNSLTPVKLTGRGALLTTLRDSPTSPGQSSNSAVAKTRLDAIAKALVDNFAKWQLAEERGLKLCLCIEGIKTKNPLSGDGCYATELKAYCDKLAIITSIFADITSNARESLKQLRALSKLSEIDEMVFYRSWHLSDFIEFLQMLVQCYEKETFVKENVMKNIAHCISRPELVRYTCNWEYPQHVDNWTKLHMTFLTEELKIKE